MEDRVIGKAGLIAIDLQNDFASQGGRFFIKGSSVPFILEVLVPWLRERKLKVAEIVSDYRGPRKGDTRVACIPGEWGFGSVLPRDVVKEPVWVKSMNDPTWTRENGGVPGSGTDEPYHDPSAFDRWLSRTVGPPEDVPDIVLFGLTADRCVLCSAQQLSFRGYKVWVLEEGTDMRSGKVDERHKFMRSVPFSYFGTPILFENLNEPDAS